jgi:hypothetical protein
MWNEGSRLCLQVPARNGVPHGNRVNIAFSAESRNASQLSIRDAIEIAAGI